MTNTVLKLEKTRDKHLDDYETINDIWPVATLEHVDPDKPRKNYLGDKEKLRFYDELAPLWKPLPEPVKNIYREIRDTYSAQQDQMVDVLSTRVDAMGLSDDTAKVLKGELNKYLFRHANIDPYFALTRTGDFWVEYYFTGINEPLNQAFLTDQDRKAFLRKLDTIPEIDKTGDKKPRAMYKLNKMLLEGTPQPGFVGDIIALMRNAAENLPEDTAPEIKEAMETQMEGVVRMFLAKTPESSYARRLQRRKGLLGFDRDIITAFKNRAMPTANEIVRIEYAKLQNANLKAMYEGIALRLGKPDKKNHLLGTANESLRKEGTQLFKEWKARVDFARNPPYEPTVRNVNRAAFLYTLGFNASSAVIQIGQLPLFVVPFLAGKTSIKEASTNTWAAFNLFKKSPTSFVVHDYSKSEKSKEYMQGARFSKSFTNYYDVNYETKEEGGTWTTRDDVGIDDTAKDFKGMTQKEVLELMVPLAKAMRDASQDGHSIFYEQLETDELIHGTGLKKWSETVNMWSGYMFHQSDRLTRHTTAAAAFLNELTAMGHDPAKGTISKAELEKAAKSAVRITERTNGGTHLTTTARYAQTGVGRVALMFRAYGVNMNYLLATEGLRSIGVMNASEADKKIARKQLAYTMMSLTAAAGVSGWPFYNLLTDILDMLFTDDDELDFDADWQIALHPMAYRGLLDSVTGMNLSSRVGLGNILWHSSRYDEDSSPAERLASTLTGPAGGTAASLYRAAGDYNEGQYWRAAEERSQQRCGMSCVRCGTPMRVPSPAGGIRLYKTPVLVPWVLSSSASPQ